MTEKISSKQKIIETEMNLFHIKGIHKTGIDEIIRKSSTGKMKKNNGKITKSIDPKSLTDFCYSIMQGGLLNAKIQRDITPFENSVKHALQYIYSLKIK